MVTGPLDLDLRRTLGNNLSWQYRSAVSMMAISSSVSKSFVLNGSSQSNGIVEGAA